MKIHGISTLFPNRSVNGAEVEQKSSRSFRCSAGVPDTALATVPAITVPAKDDKMTLVKTMKIKLPPGSPSPSEVARTLGATVAEVRSVDRLLDHLLSGSNGVSGQFV